MTPYDFWKTHEGDEDVITHDQSWEDAQYDEADRYYDSMED